MTKDDERPPHLVRRAGLVFAYVCFLTSVATIGGAIYLLPITFKVKLFLGMATLLLASLFVFLAIATHIVSRPDGAAKPPSGPD